MSHTQSAAIPFVVHRGGASESPRETAPAYASHIHILRDMRHGMAIVQAGLVAELVRRMDAAAELAQACATGDHDVSDAAVWAGIFTTRAVHAANELIGLLGGTR